jgi:hypothetical protein
MITQSVEARHARRPDVILGEAQPLAERPKDLVV